MDDRPIAELEDVTVTFGGRNALQNLDLRVEQGEFLGLVGPNGAGKTTAFRTLQGLIRPSSGQARLLGQDAYPPTKGRNARVGVQPQEVALFETLTVREQLRVFAQFRGRKEAEAVTLMERLGLSEVANTRQEKLSGGQRQRLSVACAVIGRPEVLFLDEPTANIDPVARRDMRDFFREMGREGTTVVYTSHDLNEVAGLCDRVMVLLGGQELLSDTPEAISRSRGFLTVEVGTTVRMDRLGELVGIVAMTITDGGYRFVTTDDRELQERIRMADTEARIDVRVEAFEDTYVRLVREAGASA